MTQYRFIPMALAAGISLCMTADRLDVARLRHAGPFPVFHPVMIDSVDNNDRKFDSKSLLDSDVNLSLLDNATWLSDSIIPAGDGTALHLLGFTIDNTAWFDGEVKADGIGDFTLYVDDRKSDDHKLSLSPSAHRIALKYISDAGRNDTVRVSLTGTGLTGVTVNPEGKRRYTTKDMFTGIYMGRSSLSPSGRYLVSGTYYRNGNGDTDDMEYKVTDLKTGNPLHTFSREMRWMPASDLLYYTRTRDGKTELVTVNPVTATESVLASGLPEAFFEISPDESFLIYTKIVKGPQEKDSDVYQVLNPEDRQPGWRDRSQLMKYDIATGISTPLTFGSGNAWLCGLSDNGGKALVMTESLMLGTRPSRRFSLWLVDLATMKGDCLVADDGFMAGAALSPDGSKVALIGSPEAFGGVGNVLPEGMTPNAYDNQLYVMDTATRAITPLTRDFDPAVQDARWSAFDGCIYFTAQHRDSKPLYRVNPSTGRIDNMCAREEYVMDFSLSPRSPLASYYGESPDNSYRLYTLDTRKMTSTLREDLNEARTAGIAFGETHRWEYLNAEGDTIYASYNLPPDFDPAKKYPMIVYYYGGCSPTGRYLDSTYNPHFYAANGYVALVINPRGATGFGQKYAAKHVSTAGEGVADDIITGVRQFTEEHPYVDAGKIGCLGASYGGFMTQYLQTQTDLFAAAISHAGISDHTSYWGNGYWGYSYSEVSMAGRFPWSDRELYVNQSPLYNADKINTPLLLIHGDADTNVPYGESVQLFTALRLLGKEVALVGVKGENHHILTLGKRMRWMDTMMAWFAKYLKDDPSWWNAMYPEKGINSVNPE